MMREIGWKRYQMASILRTRANSISIQINRQIISDVPIRLSSSHSSESEIVKSTADHLFSVNSCPRQRSHSSCRRD